MVPEHLAELGFQQLSTGISVYAPSLESDPSLQSCQTSRLIILCAWAFAHPKHLANYLRGHQKTFQDAQILVIQDTMRNAFWNTRSRREVFLGRAIAFIQDYLDKTNDPQVLFHIFSNGGSLAAVQLHEAVRDAYGVSAKLPISAIIFDSSPGKPRAKPIVNTLLLGLPSKNILLLIFATWTAFLIYGITAVLDALGILESATSRLYRALNDVDGSFLLSNKPGELPIPRAYIYSPQDIMIFSIDVEEHANIAVKRLKKSGCLQPTTYVSLERFMGSQHVNHLKVDSERYWSIIRETWALGPGSLKL